MQRQFHSAARLIPTILLFGVLALGGFAWINAAVARAVDFLGGVDFTVAALDCAQAAQLIEGISAEHPLADKSYDSDAIVQQAIAQGMTPVIPPRKNRTT